jgi:hypothetical protein
VRHSALALAGVGLPAACAQPGPASPVARAPYPPPVQASPQQQGPLQDASRQLFSVEQILRQLQSLRSAAGRL